MVPAFALIIDSAGKYRELTTSQVKQNLLVAARAVASEQDRVLENAHEFLVTLSRVPQIREKDRAACRKILAGLLEPRYADLALADLAGNPLCSALSRTHSLANPKGRHHSRAVEAHDFAVGDLRHDPSGAKTLLDVSYPVLDHPGLVRAIVSASIDLSWINRTAVDAHLQPGATFNLVDAKGEVLLRYPDSKDKDWVGEIISTEIASGSPLGFSRDKTIEAKGPDGIRRLFAFSPLKNTISGRAVYAAVDLPVDVAFSKTREILMRQLIALGMLSALILGSTWFGTDVLVLRRIRDIIAATKKMAAGNSGARTTLAYDASELGQMARAFDQLAEGLEKRDAEAAQAARQIHLQRQQQEALYDLNRGMTSTLDVASVLKILLDHISLLFSANGVAVSWINPRTGTLDTIACRGMETPEPPGSQALLPMLVLKQQRPLAIPDARADARATDLDSFRDQGWSSYLGLPLAVKNEVLGVLSFYGRQKHEFTSDEITFLNALVNEAAVAIHNSQLFEQTKHQAVELEKSNKIKDEFLGVMSHELRTPLNIIMNYSEALRMGTFGEIGADQARGIDKIWVQAGHLLSLINGILEITKIESGTITLESLPVAINDFMAELKSDYIKPLQNDVALLWNDAPDLPVLITDRIKLKQIVTNLINNAIKFTERGSVTVSTEVSCAGKMLDIRVADTGPGIPSEHLPFVFEKFRQIDSATTRNFSGAGLGLYIVKNFVTLLGGTIEVESTVGKGSVFSVRFPITRPAAQAAREAPAQETAAVSSV
jgi:signal transduction histidine kinase/HAMP domain-containing protein